MWGGDCGSGAARASLSHRRHLSLHPPLSPVMDPRKFELCTAQNARPRAPVPGSRRGVASVRQWQSATLPILVCFVLCDRGRRGRNPGSNPGRRSASASFLRAGGGRGERGRELRARRRVEPSFVICAALPPPQLQRLTVGTVGYTVRGGVGPGSLRTTHSLDTRHRVSIRRAQERELAHWICGMLWGRHVTPRTAQSPAHKPRLFDHPVCPRDGCLLRGRCALVR